jgi:hypothetical protein
MNEPTDENTIFLETEWPIEVDEATRKLLDAMRRRENIWLGALALMTVLMLATLGILGWWSKHH